MTKARETDSPKWQTWLDLLEWRSQHQGDHIAFTFLHSGEKEKQQLTYNQLYENARTVGSQLMCQMNPGDRALLFSSSGIEFINTLFGSLYAGIIAIPAFSPRGGNRSMDRLNAIVEDAEAKVALIDSKSLARVQSQFSENDSLKSIHFITTESLHEPTGSVNGPASGITKDSTALIQYTSGSTSQPRGVILNHRCLLHNTNMIGQAFEGKEAQVNVGWLPLYHDMGLIGNVMTPLFNGVHSVLMPPEAFLLKPLRWLKAISDFKGRTSGGPNFAFELCIDRISDEAKRELDLSSWKVAVCGAEPIRPTTLARFSEAFSISRFNKRAFYPCYGLAEGTLLVTGGNIDEEPKEYSFSAAALRNNRVEPTDISEESQNLIGCGHSWNEQEVIIVNPSTGDLCKPNQVGEICVHGNSVAKGYWNLPQLTNELFEFTPNGCNKNYLKTGDLGFFFEKHLFITGRLKGLIIVNGQNYYAEDIEATVEQAHEAICLQGAIALGIDQDQGEKVAVVAEVNRHFLRQEERKEIDLADTIKSLEREIRMKVAARHDLTLEALLLVRQMAIPKTSSGKIKRDVSMTTYLNKDFPTLIS